MIALRPYTKLRITHTMEQRPLVVRRTGNSELQVFQYLWWPLSSFVLPLPLPQPIPSLPDSPKPGLPWKERIFPVGHRHRASKPPPRVCGKQWAHPCNLPSSCMAWPSQTAETCRVEPCSSKSESLSYHCLRTLASLPLSPGYYLPFLQISPPSEAKEPRACPLPRTRP